jgi:hypothetical protein
LQKYEESLTRGAGLVGKWLSFDPDAALRYNQLDEMAKEENGTNV